jgi:ElaB/YqjD/DUF883 family membrane-anchored ribosome-binding protein
MMHTRTSGQHPSEDALVLFHYREGGDCGIVESHLAACDACRASYQALQRTLASFESLAVPEPGEGFEARMWQRVQPGLAAKAGHGWLALFSPARLALAGAMAVLVIGAFVVALSGPRPEPAAPAPGAVSDVGRDRVLLLAVIDHLDRSQRALTELVNAEPGKTVDISAEQRWVRELVPANRLYRQTAAEVGEAGMASLLDDLERVLMEIAHSPSTMSSKEFNEIRQRIESQGIIFKVRVLGSDARKRQQEAVRALARQRS